MANRVIEANNMKVKELKKMLPLSKNSCETKRIMIMCVYMGGKNIAETKRILKVSSTTVEKVVHRYKEDPNEFYKTKYRGRQLTAERKEILTKIRGLIIDSNKAEENIDIIDVNRRINREYGMQKLDYHQTWWLVRRAIHANYQKPYVKNHKQPENAEQILIERLTNALVDIGSKTNMIDEQDIKNKKTKFRRIIN